ncbi:HNH endonuclease family protein [Helcobacillus massiliensis]|uniref:HNH endonuclease family protein n=1 Tax=Helcobacillus massiliensis TaxID=521392 RepID=UPI0021A687D0|nr:HNH endonuclease family protein [Helcobacillus massiliensis]MCT1558597.1 HNH endonuclease family protein [Helcobacillus massiliensis]MCT2037426.1 HNH endonuclease family protein [Helcobacillus massiliensis]MCT2332787.1 HNH endonuclease family protein [Helcobacillus massiliensis]
MPQTLTSEWKDHLGRDAQEIHRTWLHRIGNLTVTGYNSSYSNRCFAAKQEHPEGFHRSPYRLKSDIKTATKWTAEEMEARTQRLVDQAMELWPYPQPGDIFEPPAREGLIIGLDEDFAFTSRDIEAFELDGEEAPCTTWRALIVKVIAALAVSRSDELIDYARSGTAPSILAPTDARRKAPGKRLNIISPNIAVFTGTDTVSKIASLGKSSTSSTNPNPSCASRSPAPANRKRVPPPRRRPSRRSTRA